MIKVYFQACLAVLLFAGVIALVAFVCNSCLSENPKPTIVVDITPAMEAAANKPYIEQTTYYWRSNSRWETSIQEFQYKGHSYIYMNSQSSPIHAMHCACLTTNK